MMHIVVPHQSPPNPLFLYANLLVLCARLIFGGKYTRMMLSYNGMPIIVNPTLPVHNSEQSPALAYGDICQSAGCASELSDDGLAEYGAAGF